MSITDSDATRTLLGSYFSNLPNVHVGPGQDFVGENLDICKFQKPSSQDKKVVVLSSALQLKNRPGHVRTVLCFIVIILRSNHVQFVYFPEVIAVNGKGDRQGEFLRIVEQSPKE